MLRKSLVFVACFVVFFFASGVYVFGQEEAGNFVEKDEAAIRCWLKSDKSEIRIGEIFYLTLTCQVVEIETGRVILSENTLDPGAVSFVPYEVVRGVRHQDIQKGVYRFFQYQYELRLVGEEFFGKDVPIPALEIKYRIRRLVNNRESLDDKEKVYELPSLPVKVGSLVSEDAKDIRDASEDNFGLIQTKMYRAYAAFAVSALLMLVLSAVLLAPFFRSVKEFRKKISNGTVFSNAALLRKAKRELRRIRKMSLNNNGWDKELVGRALTIFRIVGAIAMSRKINQLPTRFESRGLEGQLKLRKGFWWRTKVLISSDVTLEMIIANKDTLNSRWAEQFISVFGEFNSARYSSGDKFNSLQLGDALNQGRSLVGSLRYKNNFLVRKMNKFFGDIKRLGPVWKRS